MLSFKKRTAARGLVHCAFLGLALAGCSESNDPGESSDDLELTANVTALSLAAGGTGTIQLMLDRLRGFADSVTLSIDALPATLTATFAPVRLGLADEQSTLTLVATNAAPAGTTTLTIRATGAGIVPDILTIPLTITSSTQASYSLVASPNAVAVSRGGSGSTNIDILRSAGFSESITFTITGLPPGLTASMLPVSTTANATQFMVQASATIAPGTYAAVITGESPGLEDRAVIVAVTVMPS